MTAYLVEHIASEVSEVGLDTYEKDNIFMPIFVREGNRYVRHELFKLQRATGAGRKFGDSATLSVANWHVPD